MRLIAKLPLRVHRNCLECRHSLGGLKSVQELLSPSLSTVRIGPHALPNPVVLAPMAGITDAPVRRMAVRYGAGLVVSEMVASEALLEGHGETTLRAERAGIPLHAVQL
ncbi:MAG: hypothetical protein B7Z41_07995, partial [Rhizobiales bacterium 12-66-7]